MELCLALGRILFTMLFGLHKPFSAKGKICSIFSPVYLPFPSHFLFVFSLNDMHPAFYMYLKPFPDLQKLLINAFSCLQMKMILLGISKVSLKWIWWGQHCSVPKYSIYATYIYWCINTLSQLKTNPNGCKDNSNLKEIGIVK